MLSCCCCAAQHKSLSATELGQICTLLVSPLLDADSPEEITSAMEGVLDSEATFIMQGKHRDGLQGLLDYHSSICKRFEHVTVDINSIHLVKSTHGVHELSAEFTATGLMKLTGMEVALTGK